MSLLSRIVPSALATRLARHAVPVTVGAVALVLLAGIATAAVVSPGALGIQAARVSVENPLDSFVGALTERDADNDGLSDALENYVYGTDPEDWDSAGIGIPDGWLVQYGFDPLDPLTADARGKAPPAESLPPVYADGYPLAYTPPLSVYYSYAKPSDYRPGIDAPWWRRGEHADPVAIDQTGTGLPTGWLLHHGVPLRDLQADRVAPGSRGNLTLQEAFEHDTDPLEADSDADGLDDWTEIEVTKTHPGRFSTAGVGIADGWLVRHKLALTDPNVATQDPDRDGLTNYEEFEISATLFGPDITNVIQRGLDPANWQTAGTGIPDGWYVRYGLNPLGADVERLIGKASDFAEYRTYVPEGEQELPDIAFTVRGAYEYARPDDWNESTKGVWWGGTNPQSGDSDGDALPDAVEIRGWYANVTFDTGPEAKPRVYLATSNPLEADSDGDGLTDLEEYRGATDCGTDETRSFPPTDPRNRDTAFSQVSDLEKVCGIVRGGVAYDVRGEEGAPGLDPTKADSAGDHVKDGVRVSFWQERAESLRANPRYPYNGSAYKTVFDWTEKYARFAGLTRDQTIAQFRPDGDVDDDGIMNVADADPSGGLHAEKFEPEAARTKIYFLGGPEMDPAAYRLTEFASPVPHVATDPANPDTDGDGLPDSWETRYGRFDPVIDGWDLDPTKTDSDGDGVTDDKANNDGDVVTWYSFERRGSSNERTTRTFAFTNDLEFLAATDPNEVSSAGDGVPDGWKAFWGSRIASTTYPSLVGARDATVGSVALEAIDEIEAAIASSSIAPAADLAGAGIKTTGYVRFVNVTACPASVADQLAPGEMVPDVNPCYQGANLDNQPIRIARIFGAHTMTYADEARLRTNPYMADTDGDGAPDAYEAYYAVRTPAGAFTPDPAADDRARDGDGDGLGVADECGSTDGVSCGFETFLLNDVAMGAGADPNNGDTDGDGIQDGIESGALINPLDPSDVDSFRAGGKDTDSDGVPDFQELTGKDAKVFFGEPIRTNAKDADSDGDGLLDGETVCLATNGDAALIAAWRARGIAHDPQADGLTVCFFGERSLGQSFGLRPDELDSRDAGVPDGWLAYYNLDTTRQFEIESYTANRPSWWIEAVHGVWWWGTVPGAVPIDDLDGDGLHDGNGEDPFPGMSRVDRIVAPDITITDPTRIEAWVASATTPEAKRERAQLVGEGAGDPATARSRAINLVDPATNVYARNLRACVEIVDASAPATVDKGVAFPMTGRVVLAEREGAPCGASGGALLQGSDTARVGVPGRTVIVSVFAPGGERIVGAGFTDATGAFNVSVNITQQQSYQIPTEGLTLLSRVNGTVATRFDPSTLATGARTGTEDNRLVAWVYNSTGTTAPGAPTYGQHKARVTDRAGVVKEVTVNATRFAASDPVPVTVRAGTSIALDVPETAVNGAKIEGIVELTDASGAPLLDKTVVISWGGSTSPIELRNLTTDRNGRINLTRVGIPVGAPTPQSFPLVATFNSTDPNLIGTSTTLPIRVLSPTAITATADTAAATVGDTVSVTGDIATLPVTLPDGSTRASRAVGGATIVLVLGGVEESAKADANGRFTVRVSVPGSLGAGTQTMEVRFPGSDTESPATLSLPLGIKRTASIVELNRLEGPRTIEVLLRGKLVDNEGAGFDGSIEVVSDEFGLLARGLAATDGAFAVTVPLAPLELGTQPIRVVFPGDVAHDAAENFTQARITSTTSIALEEAPDVVVRGSTFAVRARLLDDEAKPISGQALAAYWRGQRLEVLVTDATGHATFLVPTNLTERPALTSLGIDFSPAGNSVYQPASVTRLARVVAGVTIELADADVSRGPVTVAGRLLDDERKPLAGAAVALTFDGASLGEARTSRNGSFELLHVLGDATRLGDHRVAARYAGTATLANATEEATWRVRSPLLVELTTLGPFVRGEEAVIEGRVTDDRGAPVDGAFRLFLGGRDIVQLRSSSGKLATKIDVPADLPRGASTLRLTSEPTDAYEPYAKEIPIIIKIRPKVEVELPQVVIRGFAIGGAVSLYDDQGQPLRNTSFAYAIGSGRGAVVSSTDADGTGSIAGVAPVAGDAALALTVRGGSDVVPAQYTASTMRVVGPASPIGYAVLAIAVLVILLIVGLVVAAIILRRRQLQEAREILDEAIRDLLAGNEYAGTIFLAYRRFGAYLSRHGFAEKASDTPREFAAGVRKALPIGAPPLRALIGLFEEARYSDHAIGSSERDRAVESLTQVRNELDTVLGQKKVSA